MTFARSHIIYRPMLPWTAWIQNRLSQLGTSHRDYPQSSAPCGPAAAHLTWASSDERRERMQRVQWKVGRLLWEWDREVHHMMECTLVKSSYRTANLPSNSQWLINQLSSKRLNHTHVGKNLWCDGVEAIKLLFQQARIYAFRAAVQMSWLII